MARKSKKVNELLEAVANLNAIRIQMEAMKRLVRSNKQQPLLDDFRKLERVHIMINRKVRSLANQLHVKIQN